MNNDLISRSELKKHKFTVQIRNGVAIGEIEVVSVATIDNAPPVTPQPKSGHWVEEKINAGSRKVFCSECGCPPPFEYVNTGDVYSASGYGVINKTKFCPNCGALMKGGAE